jgi:NAD-dependent SIR2 family protein deacetylase
VYSEVPDIFNVSTAAVIFVGTSTKVTDVHGIKKDNQFANTLEDKIIQRGAPNRHFSDRVQAIIISKVEDILRTFVLTAGKVNLTSITRTTRNDDTRP